MGPAWYPIDFYPVIVTLETTQKVLQKLSSNLLRELPEKLTLIQGRNHSIEEWEIIAFKIYLWKTTPCPLPPQRATLITSIPISTKYDFFAENYLNKTGPNCQKNNLLENWLELTRKLAENHSKFA